MGNPGQSFAWHLARIRRDPALVRGLQRAVARLRRARRRHRRHGVVWVRSRASISAASIAASARARSTDPRPPAIHCPEGWSFHQYPGPGFEGIGENSAESSYYTWVDQHDTFGLGRNVPVSTGNLNDGLIAYANGRMVVLRVPYPLGFYAKGLDGRIDDPNAGWKGRGCGQPTANARRGSSRRQGHEAARRAFSAAA
jgi:hypothetical protein